MSLARWIRLATAVSVGVAASVGAATAQTDVCLDLQARLIALDRGASTQSAENYRAYDASVARQRTELDQATAESRRAGCVGGLFIFRRAPDPKCPELMATIDRMRANFDRLTAARNQYATDPIAVSRQRNELLRGLSANRCGSSYASYGGSTTGGGLLAALFGQPRVRPFGENAFYGGVGYGTYRTLCVRTCDGYYFPISFSTVPDRFAADQQTCQAMCPGTEVRLFTHRNPGQDASEMVSVTGEPYTALPTAFRYRNEYDAACKCGQPQPSIYDQLSIRAASLASPIGLAVPEPVAPVVPVPSLRQPRGEDPETVANRAGGFTPAPLTAPDAEGDAIARVVLDGDRRIRIVGPEFYVAR